MNRKTRRPMQILITETNVDGCGGNAVVPVLFQRTLTEQELQLLKDILFVTKQYTPADERDTNTMVSEALTRFHKSVPVSYTFNHFHNLTF